MRKNTLLTIFLLLAMAAPAMAESRSRTVQASCYIAPSINLSRTGLERFEDRSRRDHQFQRSHSLHDGPEGRVKLYSLTAL